MFLPVDGERGEDVTCGPPAPRPRTGRTDSPSPVIRHTPGAVGARRHPGRGYREAASGAQKGQLVYSEEQNVPADVSGMRAAVVIEAIETHTRTGFADIDLSRIPNIDAKTLESLGDPVVEVPVTHAKVFGWYDNEYGSYTNLMGDLTVHVHRSLD